MLSAPELEALVGAHQILHREGHGDGILGHVSLRDPEQAGFWIKRADIGLDEVVGAHSFMLLDLDGVRLYGDGPCHSEWPIHAETMRAHRHINSVVHTHAPSSALLASTNEPLVGFTSEGAYFGSTPVPLFDGGKAHIDEASRARRMAAALNGGLALLIRNHASDLRPDRSSGDSRRLLSRAGGVDPNQSAKPRSELLPGRPRLRERSCGDAA